MHENHQREQYFFDPPTLSRLADFVANWENPRTVCAPMLGKTLVERGVPVAILDIDTRFASLPGYRTYDLYRPEWIDAEFGLIVCDPPFFNVSLSQLFDAMRQLSHFRLDQPLLVSYLSRRAEALLGTFHPFGLRPTGYFPGYQTVQRCARNDIEFFSNIPADRLASLLTADNANA